MLEIDRKNKEFVLYCDMCGKSINCYSFDDAVQYKKDNEWSSEKQKDGEWVELCEKCTEEIK